MSAEPSLDDQREMPADQPDAVRVLIVDEHHSVADAFEARLSAEPDLEVVGLAQTRVRAGEMVKSRRPTLAIVNIHSYTVGGLELVAAIRHTDRRLPVIVIANQADSESMVRLIRAGASSVVLAQSTLSEFLSTVRGVARGESHIPPALLTPVLLALQKSTPPPNDAQRRLSLLSPREEEVLALLVNGYDRHVIAGELRLSVNTVRTHVKNILLKLEAHSSLEAVSVALRAGVRPDPAAPPRS